MLGFSPHKNKLFDLESDIDVAIISANLYERLMFNIHDYQMQLRSNRRKVSSNEISTYHEFLEYTAIGWMRPDLLPHSFRVRNLKDQWFDFFKSLSYGKSEVGNHKVTAGAFKSYRHLELYTSNGIKSVRSKRLMGK